MQRKQSNGKHSTEPYLLADFKRRDVFFSREVDSGKVGIHGRLETAHLGGIPRRYSKRKTRVRVDAS